jgi:Tfp pilus assembly protein PilO
MRIVKSISPLEISVVVVLLVAVVAIVLVYAYSILPGQVKYAQLSSAHESNATKIDGLRAKVHDPASVRQEYDNTVVSLERFRGELLKPRLPGRIAIVREVNRLTTSNAITLRGGVDFATDLTPEEEGETAEGKKSSSRSTRKRSDEDRVYSSLTFSLSVSGRYDRLRKFISEFEKSPQFIVIDSINLVPGDEDASEDRKGGGESLPGDTLTLEIKLTAYFQPQTDWSAVQEIAAAEPAGSGA